jgi:hypothetical protein
MRRDLIYTPDNHVLAFRVLASLLPRCEAENDPSEYPFCVANGVSQPVFPTRCSMGMINEYQASYDQSDQSEVYPR